MPGQASNPDDDLVLIPPSDDDHDDDDDDELDRTTAGHIEVFKTARELPLLPEIDTTRVSVLSICNVTKKQTDNKLKDQIDELKNELDISLSAPMFAPRFFIKGKIGNTSLTLLLDGGANVSVMPAELVSQLEALEGPFDHADKLPFTVEDHQKNPVPIKEIVFINVFAMNRFIRVPFLVQTTEEEANSNHDSALLGANFVMGISAEIIWQHGEPFIRIHGAPDTTTKLVKETNPLLSSHLSALSLPEALSAPAASVIEAVHVSPDSSTSTQSNDSSSQPCVDTKDADTTSSCILRSLPCDGPEPTPAPPTPEQPATPVTPKTSGPGNLGDPARNCGPTQIGDPEEGIPEHLLETPGALPLVPEVKPTDWRDILDLADIPEEHRPFMTEWFDTFKDILSLHAADIGFVSDPRFAFPLNIDPSFILPACKPYPAPPEACKMIREITHQWLELKLVEPSTSTGCVPTFLVAKSIPPGANLKQYLIMPKRLVADVRLQNSMTLPWPNKLPNINYIHDSFLGSTVFSRCDLSSAYLNFPVREEDRHYLSFVTSNHDIFQFCRMPFGLRNAGSFFQHAMEVMYAPLQGRIVVYLDDLVLHSRTLEEHKELLKEFGEITKSYGLKISPKKCEWFKDSVKFLSFIVDGKGTSISEDKVAAIRDFERPTTCKQVNSFVGMAGWMQRYISGFQELAAPLSDLFKKGSKFEWTEVHEQSFQKIKSAIIHATSLSHPDFSRPFHVFTDSSRLAVGAGIFQLSKETPADLVENVEHPPIEYLVPIAFHSKKLNPTQRKYPALEQEVLAIISALHHFRYYVAFSPQVILHTDSRNILWLLSHNFNSTNRKLERYSMILLAYPNISIHHFPGKLNTLADCLSRQYDSQETNTAIQKQGKEMTKEDIKFTPPSQPVTLDTMLKIISDNPAIINSLHLDQPMALQCQKLSGFFRKFTSGYLMKTQGEDEWCSGLVKELLTLPNHENERFHFTHGLLVRKPRSGDTLERIVIPKKAQPLVLAYLHSFGHLSYKRLHCMLNQYFWFPRSLQACRDFAMGCTICQAHNRHKHGLQETTNMLLPERVNHIWSLDFMSITKSHGVSHLLNILDDFSGFLVSFPCSSEKSGQVTKALKFCFAVLGKPEVIRSDHGTSLLQSAPVKKLCLDWGITRLSLGIPNIPTKNAKVERAHQSLRTILKALADQFKTSFLDILPLANFVFNSTPHRLGHLSPFEIFTGRKVRLDFPSLDNAPDSMRDHLKTAKENHQKMATTIKQQQERHRRADLEMLNRDRKHLHFTEGDIVLLLDLSTPASGDRPKKERPTYLKTPYLIRKRLNNLCVLESILDRRVRHASVNHLKHLVNRGQIFKDLPQEFQSVFGHPFNPFQLLQQTIPNEVAADFGQTSQIRQRPRSPGPAVDTSVRPPGDTSAPPIPAPPAPEDSDESDEVSDTETEVSMDKSPSQPAQPSSQPGPSLVQTTQPQPQPIPQTGNLRDRVRRSGRQFAQATRQLLRRRKK
jgi:transposase InsO family protein